MRFLIRDSANQGRKGYLDYTVPCLAPSSRVYWRWDSSRSLGDDCTAGGNHSKCPPSFPPPAPWSIFLNYNNLFFQRAHHLWMPVNPSTPLPPFPQLPSFHWPPYASPPEDTHWRPEILLLTLHRNSLPILASSCHDTHPPWSPYRAALLWVLPHFHCWCSSGLKEVQIFNWCLRCTTPLNEPGSIYMLCKPLPSVRLDKTCIYPRNHTF